MWLRIKFSPSRLVVLPVGLVLVLYTAAHSVVSQTQTRTAESSTRGEQSTSPGEQQLSQLEIGKPIVRQISGGQGHAYRILATVGNYLSVVVDQRAVDVMVTLFAPDGRKILEVDSPNGAFGPEQLMTLVDATGQHRIEIRTFRGNAAAGAYEIRIQELRAANEEDKSRVAMVLAAQEALTRGMQLANKSPDSARSAIVDFENALGLWRQIGQGYWEALCLSSLGQTYSSLGDKQKALDYYNQALRLQRGLVDRRGEATTLDAVAEIHHQLGEEQKALDYFNKALPLRRLSSDLSGELTTLRNLGSVYDALGEKQKALEFYTQALTIVRALGNPTTEAITLMNIGAAYDSLGEKRKAIDHYNQALLLQRSLSDLAGEALTLINIGVAYGSLGDKQKALESYNQALRVWRAVGYRPGEAVTLVSIGAAYDSLGDKQKALDFYNQALPLFRALGHRNGEATTLTGIGVVYSALGEKQKALDFYSQALLIQRTLGDRSGEATTLHNIGVVYDDLGEKQKALDFYNQSLPLRRALGDRSGEATTLKGIGSVYDDLGDKQIALDFYNQSLPISRAVGDRKSEAITLHSIGVLYGSLGEMQKALDYFNQALPVHRAVGNRNGEAASLNNIGYIYSALGEKQKALESYNQALLMVRGIGDRRDEATTLNNIGGAYDDLGEKQKALDFYNQALLIQRAVGNRSGEVTVLNNIGYIYNDLGEKRKALEFYSLALPLVRAVGDRKAEATLFGNLMLLWSDSNTSLAIYYGKESANLYQQLRGNITGLEKDIQKTFLRSVEKIYRALAQLLIVQGRLPEANQVLNLFKDQQFFDFNRNTEKPASRLTLTAREASITQRYEQTTIHLGVVGQKVSELKRNIGTRQPNADEAAQLQQLEAQVKTASDEFLAILKQAETEFSQPASEKDNVGEIAETRELQAALGELKQQTGKNPVALYTLVGENSFHALIITAETITAASQQIKGDALDQRALQLWGLLQSDKYDPKLLAQELYSTVFKPIEAFLPKDTTTILWSLDGNLRYLPMGALYDGKQYLIERYNHVVFTRADRERLLRAVSSRWTGLGLGSSEAHTVELLGDKISFNALPGVTEELRALFRQRDSPGGVLEGEVLPDAKFTKAAMLAALKQKRPVVHISSHFSFRPGDEARSFLLLGDGTAMTLEEMKQQVDLFAGVELLTLSACNTAAQQVGANGREIDGFAELAQRLGAGSVMATLWPVADNSTPWLMHEFYESRQSGKGLSKAEAFRRAQLALLNGTAQTKPLPASQKGPSSVAIAIGPHDAKRDGGATRADVVYVAAKDAPRFERDDKKPFAHPYYWAPFILIGNWR